MDFLYHSLYDHLYRYAVFRGANKQKHVFKKNPLAPLWGVPPKVIGGKLLASGYWYYSKFWFYFSFCVYFSLSFEAILKIMSISYWFDHNSMLVSEIFFPLNWLSMHYTRFWVIEHVGKKSWTFSKFLSSYLYFILFLDFPVGALLGTATTSVIYCSPFHLAYLAE